MLPLADKVGKVLLFAIGLIMILDHFHIDIKSILFTLGIGSLAVGLGLQDTLANILGGFTIMLDRPFCVTVFFVFGVQARTGVAVDGGKSPRP